MIHPSEINALLFAVARQDPEAFRMLYERTSGYLMAYYNGWRREELARHFGVSDNTIKTWLRRGLIALRARMDGDEHGGE
jgi:RNA polymerase sigma-70 factor, ECF subfamily